MFNLTQFLKGYDKKAHWNYRVKKYIQASNKLLEFNKDKTSYYCNAETAINFIEASTIQADLILTIANELYKRRILELRSEVNIRAVEAPKVVNSLESEHFNIYGVSNINELADNIIIDIKKVKPENIKEVFKDYVYFFTYFYKYNSIRTHVSAIRKAIIDSDLSDEVKEIAVHEFKFSDRVHDWLNDGNKQIRVKNMTEILVPIEVPFLTKFINSSKKYIDMKIDKHNKKIAFTHLTALVALGIGRRLTEIITQSEVQKVSEYKVKVIGLGKKRSDEEAIIIIPTLFLNADEILGAVKALRNLVPKGLKYKEQRDKYAHNLADFKMIDKKLWVHGSKFASLRAIYAIVSELIYNQNNIIEENRKPQATFIQTVLGHGSEDFTTYQHYYKRQVLLKDFNLYDYLNTSKTAML